MTKGFPEELPARALVVFAKPPEPGRVKTRLTGRIDGETAAELYEGFLHDTAATVGRAAADDDRSAALLAHTGRPTHDAFDRYRELDYRFVRQGEGGLGAKLARITDRCFDAGAERVCIVGSDSPTLQRRHLESGLGGLDEHDLVLGPSFDGGYYLIALREANTAVFDGVDWSTPRVLGQTLRRANTLGLLSELIEFWYDIDTFDDLEYLRFHLLEYLAPRSPDVAPETAKLLRRLQQEGVFREGESSGRS